jgi:hypothetical protein
MYWLCIDWVYVSIYFSAAPPRNLLPKTCAVGYPALGLKPLILNRAAPGKMAFVKALMAPLETTSLVEKSFIALKKPRSSLGSGSSITTMTGPIVL